MSRRELKIFIESYNNANFVKIEDRKVYFVASNFAAKGIQKVLNSVAIPVYQDHASGKANAFYFPFTNVGTTKDRRTKIKAALLG